MRRAAATKEKAVSRIVLCGGDVATCGVGGHKIKSLRNKKTTIASRPERLLCPRQGSWAGWSEWRSPCRSGYHNQWSMGHIIRLIARMVKCMESRRDHGGQVRWLICWLPPHQPLIVSPCNSSHSLLFRTKSWRLGDPIKDYETFYWTWLPWFPIRWMTKQVKMEKDSNTWRHQNIQWSSRGLNRFRDSTPLNIHWESPWTGKGWSKEWSSWDLDLFVWRQSICLAMPSEDKYLWMRI